MKSTVKKYLLIISILSGIYSFQVSGQSNFWLAGFSLPDTVEITGVKKSMTTLKSELSIYETFITKNLLSVYKVNAFSYYEQQCEYLFTNFHNGVNNNYMNLSGRYIRKALLPFNTDFGLDWRPGFKLYRSEKDATLQVPLEIGPLVKMHIAEIPVEIRTGLSGYGWNDEMEHPTTKLSRSSYHGDLGYYGDITIGDSLQRWLNLPIVANVKAHGNYEGNKGLGVIKSALHAAWDYGTGDSLYLLFGDSLSNGKELNPESSRDALYAPIPWKIEHNLSLTGAVRGKERFFLRPAIVYNFALNTIRYPSLPDLQDDLKKSKNSLNLQITSNESKAVVYNGGITFSRENIDWLYSKSSSEIQNDKQARAVNINDSRQINAFSDHEVTIHLPSGFALNYQLHAVKNSRLYPYIDSISDTVQSNQDEGDRVRFLNHWKVLFNNQNRISLELFGEKVKTYNYYYRKYNSGNSEIVDEYKVGVNTGIKAGNVSISENLFAIAEKADYKFKEVHKGAVNFNPPPYSRNLASLLIVSWMINDYWKLTGKWNETYFDHGKWYNRDYSDTVISIQKDYYAIENTTLDYSFQVESEYLTETLMIGAGLLFKDSNRKNYDQKTRSYIVNNLGKGYDLNPTLKCRYILSGKFQVNSAITRKFNTLDNNRFKFDKNWDISLLFKIVF